MLLVAVVMVSTSVVAQAPATSQEDVTVAGALVYRARCQSCHGPNMVLAGGAAYDLRKFPANDPERFRTSVLEGRGGMPAWKGVLSPLELEQLWAYVRVRREQR